MICVGKFVFALMAVLDVLGLGFIAFVIHTWFFIGIRIR